MDHGRHDFDWEDLLGYIESREVIPIVGKELLTITVDGREAPLERHLAERLAVALGLPTGELSGGFGLNEVAMACAAAGRHPTSPYSKLKSLLDEMGPELRREPPSALRQLAEITDFTLYVSTTFDVLLYEALASARAGPDHDPIARIVWSPRSKPEDLPCEPRALQRCTVGSASREREYALSDEDTLELMHILPARRHVCPRLFEAFKGSHLLFLGCGFPDWLARFFMRTMADQRLFERAPLMQDFVADGMVGRDPNLVLFLRHLHRQVYPPGDPIAFVHRRWGERRPARPEHVVPLTSAATPMAVPPGTVFLSYASQDRAAVRTLKSALEAAGIAVFFDQHSISPGADWELQIRTVVRDCGLFLPFVSRHAAERDEGWFVKEWELAIERAQGVKAHVPFIQPIVIDDLPERDPRIPEYFWTRQCRRFPGGVPEPGFVERTKMTLRDIQLRKVGVK